MSGYVTMHDAIQIMKFYAYGSAQDVGEDAGEKARQFLEEAGVAKD